LHQPEHYLESRGLAGPVRAQKTEHVTVAHLQIDPLEDLDLASAKPYGHGLVEVAHIEHARSGHTRSGMLKLGDGHVQLVTKSSRGSWVVRMMIPRKDARIL
jgi:hypothetical protein